MAALVRLAPRSNAAQAGVRPSPAHCSLLPRLWGGGRACSHVLPGRHSERLCRGRGRAVKGPLSRPLHTAAVRGAAAANPPERDQGREGRRAARVLG